MVNDTSSDDHESQPVADNRQDRRRGSVQDTEIKKNEGPGRGFVPISGIVVLASVLFITAGLAIYSLIQFWPDSGNGTDSAAQSVRWLWWRATLSDEKRLFVVVLTAGALGGLAHSVRSLYWYVGNRKLHASWTLMYLTLPLTGAGMALLIYLLLRGGLTTSLSTSETVNPYGVAAISALAGLFSREAVEKLKAVFETLLGPAEKGKDSLAAAVIDDFSPPEGHLGENLTISGTGLLTVSHVKFGSGAVVSVTPTSDVEITLKVPEGAQTGPVSVSGPAGTAVSERSFTVLGASPGVRTP